MHVRAMFRVLAVSIDYAKRRVVKLGATYATRDGVECAENKSFSKWTPSGECEIVTDDPLFVEGGYYYLDIYRASEAPEAPAGLRTAWQVLRVEVEIGSFTPRLYPPNNSPLRGSMHMTITNLSEVTLGMFALRPDGDPIDLIVDFSAA